MKKYVIPNKRKEFLLKKFKEFSYIPGGDGEDLEADKEAFDEITDPAEIFFIVENYNWDDGPSVLNWVIDSPLCTKAAALIIFWTSAPDYYMEFELGSSLKIPNGRIDHHNTEIFRLIEKVVKRVEENNFNEFNIYFDSTKWCTKLHVNNPKWSINVELFSSANGVQVV